MRDLHVKIAIERIRGLSGPKLQQALAAAIDAMDVEKGPFQPGTEEYEYLLNVVKRHACRHQIEEIEARKDRLEVQLRERDNDLNVWKNRLEDVEYAATASKLVPAHRESLLGVADLITDLCDPRSPKPAYQHNQVRKRLDDVQEKRPQKIKRKTSLYNMWGGRLSRDHSRTTLSMNSSETTSEVTPESDRFITDEFHAL